MSSAVLLGLLPTVVAAVVAWWWLRRSVRATGRHGWPHTARTLPWGERYQLWRASAGGRALQDRRLAALVVQRNEYVLAVSQHMFRQLRWIFLAAGALLLLCAVFFAVTGNWQLAGLLLAVLVLGIAQHVLLHRHTLARVERTTRENQRRLEE